MKPPAQPKSQLHLKNHTINDQINQSQHRLKYDRQTTVLITFIVGFLGLHLWYLKKPLWQIFAYIITAIIGGVGFSFLAQNDWAFGYMWLAAGAGVINLLCAWFSCIFYALAPKWRWLSYIQGDNTIKQLNNKPMNVKPAANGLDEPNDVQASGVFIAIICLMLSMGGLMAFLALLFQRYYEFILGA